MKHFNSIKAFNQYIGYKAPQKDLIDVVCHDDYSKLRLSTPEISTDFYLLAFKRNMSDLQWYGNTKYDRESAFLYVIKPNQSYQWDVKELWSGYHIMISPILLQEYNINFSFFQYEVSEALFLTETEQQQIETLYQQIIAEYRKDNYELDLLLAYTNLIFAYISTSYKRQFRTRQPLYNKVVVEFKKELNSYFSTNQNYLPTVQYFAKKSNLSTNYFGDLIKHQTGTTASELIQDKIIKEAKLHLKNSNKSISEIGYALGFEYPTYFGRFFKKHTGLTPSQFRKK